MKSTGKIAVIILMLLAAGSLSLSAQRGMRGMRADSARMQRAQHGMMPMRDSLHMRMPGRGMGQMMPMRPMRPMAPMVPGFDFRSMRSFGPQFGMGQWRRQHMMFPRMNPGQGMQGGGMGMRFFENIPNLTDKQKKDIADLRQKQQDEMQKFRSDMQAKMREMRESYRSKVRGMLNDEQKKWFDENTPKPPEK